MVHESNRAKDDRDKSKAYYLDIRFGCYNLENTVLRNTTYKLDTEAKESTEVRILKTLI